MWSETIIEEPSHSYTMKGGKKQKRKHSLSIPRMLTMDAYIPDEMEFERSMSPVRMVSEDTMDDFFNAVLDEKKYDISMVEYNPAPVIYKDATGKTVGYEKIYKKQMTITPKRKIHKKKRKTRKARK